MKSETFKKSIADAKAIRDASVELAKEQIAESLGPKIQEIVRQKLSEAQADLEEGELEEYGDEHPVSTQDALDMSEGSDMEIDEVSLDEILQELEQEELAEKEEVAEVKYGKEMKTEAKGDDDEEETEEEETEEETEEEGGEEGAEGEEGLEGQAGEEIEGEAEQVSDISVDELKDIIRDVLISMGVGGETDNLEDIGGEEGAEGMEGIGGEEGGSDDLELGGDVAEEISLDEILASLEEQDEDTLMEKKEDKKEVDELKAQLQEAEVAIKKLTKQLSESTLIQAKLFYVNKIYKGMSLTEDQKIKVLNTVDKAETVKEAKKIFETLKESLSSKKGKKPLRESIGFASRPSGVVGKPKANTIVQDEVVNRFQILAGIKKPY